jgi:hypothetical protein
MGNCSQIYKNINPPGGNCSISLQDIPFYATEKYCNFGHLKENDELH